MTATGCCRSTPTRTARRRRAWRSASRSRRLTTPRPSASPAGVDGDDLVIVHPADRDRRFAPVDAPGATGESTTFPSWTTTRAGRIDDAPPQPSGPTTAPPTTRPPAMLAASIDNELPLRRLRKREGMPRHGVGRQPDARRRSVALLARRDVAGAAAVDRLDVAPGHVPRHRQRAPCLAIGRVPQPGDDRRTTARVGWVTPDGNESRRAFDDLLDGDLIRSIPEIDRLWGRPAHAVRGRGRDEGRLPVGTRIRRHHPTRRPRTRWSIRRGSAGMPRSARSSSLGRP